MIDADIVVIGAGPAGSIAAKHAALRGAKVILIDKKSEIGTPKRCAEGVYDPGLRLLGIEPNPRWIAQTIYGGVLHSPDGNSIQFDEELLPVCGYVLERKVFDKYMAMDAARAGAEIMIKTFVSDLKREGDGFILDCDSFGEKFQIRAKIVIGADGPESTIGIKAGLNKHNSNKYMLSCAQYEMCNVELPRDDLIHIFLADENAEGGYAWIFTKGNGVANVGLGISSNIKDLDALECLDNFVKSCPYTKNAQPMELNVGPDSLEGLKDNIYGDNIMLVGDAAGQIDPIEGGGILLGMYGGMVAGNVAASAIKQGDYSADKLKEYYERFNQLTLNLVPKLTVVRDVVQSLNGDEFSNLIDAASQIDLANASTKDYLKVLFKISPRTSLKFTKLINVFI